MMEQFENDLEQLLINKAFNDLSSTEKEYALKLLSEREYNNYHLVLSQSIKALDIESSTLSPSLDISRNLKYAFKIKHKNTFSWASLLNQNTFRFYGYQTLIASIIIVFFAYLIGPVFVTKKIAIQNVQKKEIEKKVILTNHVPNKIDNHLIFTSRSVNKKLTAKSLVRSSGKIVLSKTDYKQLNNEVNYLCSSISIPNILDEEMRDTLNSNTPCLNSRLIVPDSEILENPKAINFIY